MINELYNNMFPIDKNDSKIDVSLPEITVKFEIKYDDNDNISNFVNYIMDLDISKNSFYFAYKMVINKEVFIEKLKIIG